MMIFRRCCAHSCAPPALGQAAPPPSPSLLLFSLTSKKHHCGKWGVRGRLLHTTSETDAAPERRTWLWAIAREVRGLPHTSQ